MTSLGWTRRGGGEGRVRRPCWDPLSPRLPALPELCRGQVPGNLSAALTHPSCSLLPAAHWSLQTAGRNSPSDRSPGPGWTWTQAGGRGWVSVSAPLGHTPKGPPAGASGGGGRGRGGGGGAPQVCRVGLEGPGGNDPGLGPGPHPRPDPPPALTVPGAGRASGLHSGPGPGGGHGQDGGCLSPAARAPRR